MKVVTTINETKLTCEAQITKEQNNFSECGYRFKSRSDLLNSVVRGLLYQIL